MKSINSDSKSFRKLNPHIFPNESFSQPIERVDVRAAKRIRQDSKPLMNKLETEFMRWLESAGGRYHIKPQDVTFKIANGCRYTPDFTCECYSDNTANTTKNRAYEVKGKWFTDDSNVKIKAAAAKFTNWTFILVWKKDGQWQQQIVLP